MSRLIIGIDNGLDGAIIGLNVDGAVVMKEVMPTVGLHQKGKRAYDLPAMALLLHGIEDVHVYLERAQAMPGQGVSSTFSIGYGYGAWQGILTALQMPFTIVGPREWQKVMFEGVDKTDTKKASALIARRLQPGTDWRASERARTPHDGLTDAYCIAEYGRRKERL
jgi:crossover junction endodeoxyribonuclease RuvC